MKDKTTLFEYLYENLKEQIVSGRIKCGESLPSMNSVSEQYNIGIRTVKDVFRALSSEGYIKTEERKAAVVIYSDNKDSQESAVKYVLERKSFIVEVYQTMALLMPELFCFSSQVCGQKYLDLWEKSLSRSKKKDTQSRWSVASDFLYDILNTELDGKKSAAIELLNEALKDDEDDISRLIKPILTSTYKSTYFQY